MSLFISIKKKVHGQNGSIREIEGHRVVIATGSRCLDLPDLPVDHKRIINSDDALELAVVPGRLVVAGGGVIGCELAFIFQALGSTITIMEELDRILPIPSIDADLSKLIQKTFLCFPLTPSLPRQ